MRKLALIIIVAGLAMAGYFALQRYKSRGASPPAAAHASLPAPRLLLTDLEGNAFNTSAYQGKVVLVNFWAAWCTPCAAEIPQFVAMQEKYRLQGLQILGISMDDEDSVLRKFCREHKMNYPVVPGDQKIADAYGGVLGLPTTFVIGRDGRIAGRYAGSTDFPVLEKEVVNLLQKAQPSTL